MTNRTDIFTKAVLLWSRGQLPLPYARYLCKNWDDYISWCRAKAEENMYTDEMYEFVMAILRGRHQSPYQAVKRHWPESLPSCETTLAAIKQKS